MRAALTALASPLCCAAVRWLLDKTPRPAQKCANFAKYHVGTGVIGDLRPLCGRDHVDQRSLQPFRADQQVAGFRDVDLAARAGKGHAARGRIDREPGAVHRCGERPHSDCTRKKSSAPGTMLEDRLTGVAGDEFSGARTHEGHARARARASRCSCRPVLAMTTIRRARAHRSGSHRGMHLTTPKRSARRCPRGLTVTPVADATGFPSRQELLHSMRMRTGLRPRPAARGAPRGQLRHPQGPRRAARSFSYLILPLLDAAVNLQSSYRAALAAAS